MPLLQLVHGISGDILSIENTEIEIRPTVHESDREVGLPQGDKKSHDDDNP